MRLACRWNLSSLPLLLLQVLLISLVLLPSAGCSQDPGGEDTICVSQNIESADDAAQWTSTYVSVERMVGGFAADGTPEAWVNFPVGVAADPGSDDTARANADYLAGRYHKFLFRRDEIEAALREQRFIQR